MSYATMSDIRSSLEADWPDESRPHNPKRGVDRNRSGKGREVDHEAGMEAGNGLPT